MRLAQMLDDNQAALSGTPELIDRWHIAHSLAQHARAVIAREPPAADASYEAAWSRFRTRLRGRPRLHAHRRGRDATWSAMPAVTGQPEVR